MTNTFSERLAEVRNRIKAACEKSGRDPKSVRILAASKAQPPEKIREAAECGLTLFGENRVQEARQKIPLSPSGLEWHMIGHLQTNKAREATRLFQMTHSVDSPKLLEAIDAAGESAGRVARVCLEINVSGESSKFGLPPEAAPEIFKLANGLKHLEITGLMTIPPVAEDPDAVRHFFARLRALREQWRDLSGFALNELSMGMSHDFEVAIEEGATIVRLGTVLFGRRETQERPKAEG